MYLRLIHGQFLCAWVRGLRVRSVVHAVVPQQLSNKVTPDRGLHDDVLPPSGVLFPPTRVHHASDPQANTAINHPDLDEHSMASYIHQKTRQRQRKPCKRRTRQRQGRHGRRKASRSGCCLCISSGVLLAALLATCKPLLLLLI